MNKPMPSRWRASGPFAVLLAALVCGMAHAGDPPASSSVVASAPAAPLALPEGFWAARSDRYSVAWGSVTLGEGTIALKPADGGCYDYRSTTDPIALVRWTYGSPSETSRFCVRDDLVRPQRFQYSNDKRSGDNFSLDFDAGTQRVKKIKGGVVTEIKAPDPSYDRFSIREAVRLWAAENADRIGAEKDFAFIDEKDVRIYRFRIEARETVQVPAGKFETLRVARIDHPKKSYRYWLAPSRNFVPVKIQHINKGKTELSMELLGAG